MRYNELTRRYFDSASRAGTLSAAFRGAAGHPSQGTWVQFDVQVVAGAIADVRFLAFACPHTIAVAAWLAEESIGSPVGRDMPRSVAALREQFAVPIEKLGRLLLIEDAWRAALTAATIDSIARAPTLRG